MKKFLVLLLINMLLTSGAFAREFFPPRSKENSGGLNQIASKNDKSFKLADATQNRFSVQNKGRRGQSKKKSKTGDNPFYLAPNNPTRQKGSFSAQEISGIQQMLKSQIPQGVSALSDLPNDITPLLSSPDVKLTSLQNKPTPYSVALSGEPLNANGVKLLYDVVSKIKQKVAPLESKRETENREHEKKGEGKKIKKRENARTENDNQPRRDYAARYEREKAKRNRLIARQMAEFQAKSEENRKRESKEKQTRKLEQETKTALKEEILKKTKQDILRRIQQIVEEKLQELSGQKNDEREAREDSETYEDTEEQENDAQEVEYPRNDVSADNEPEIEEREFENSELNKKNPKNLTEGYSPIQRRLLAQQKAREKAREKERQKKENVISEIPQWDMSKDMPHEQKYNENFSENRAKSSSYGKKVALSGRVRRGAAGGISRQGKTNVSRRSVQRKEKKVAPKKIPVDNEQKKLSAQERENEANIKEDTEMIVEYLSSRPNLQPDIPRGIR